MPSARACCRRLRIDGAASEPMIARTATAAQAQKPIVKASFVGRPCGVLWEVISAAMTAVPMLLPMVRAMVLTLIASPVWVAGTLSMMALDVAARARPMPAPVSSPESDDLPDLVVGDRGEDERCGDRERADEHGRLWPDLADHDAGQRSEDDHHQHGGQQEEAGFGDGFAESVADGGRAAGAGSGPARRCRTSRSRGRGRRRGRSIPRGS